MKMAFRDVLTDLLLLGDVHDISVQVVQEQLMGAEVVYQEEIENSS